MSDNVSASTNVLDVSAVGGCQVAPSTHQPLPLVKYTTVTFNASTSDGSKMHALLIPLRPMAL